MTPVLQSRKEKMKELKQLFPTDRRAAGLKCALSHKVLAQLVHLLEEATTRANKQLVAILYAQRTWLVLLRICGELL
jgi:hypothetical protein